MSATKLEPRNFMIMSGYHDYRTKRRANLHFIADELAKRGSVFFFSLRYSYLTKYREDPRHELWDRSNKFELSNSVNCYLWRTPIHPFRLPRKLAILERVMFELFSSYLPRAIKQQIMKTDIAFIESGASIIYARLLKQMNPSLTLIYMASDSLTTINQAACIRERFDAFAHLFESARVPSPYLAHELPKGLLAYYIPHGIDKRQFEHIGASPYKEGTVNAVSVGSMLFDASFFRIAGELFPDIVFHVIGSGYEDKSRKNVLYYSEMPFSQTLPYIKYANFAIAPYGQDAPRYLTHTSMKLSQYDYLGVPAVCPVTVAGKDNRFGYIPEDADSIRRAVSDALECKAHENSYLSWSDVTDRLLHPKIFSDTSLSDSRET
jgi:2-beta-glucuronyltransferase